MKAMIFADLITSRNSSLQLIGIALFVAVCVTISIGTLAAAMAALVTMVPLMYLFSISAYDEMNGWERFRMTLPISRHQVAYGRYASMLLITAVSLVLAIVIALLVGALLPLLPEGILPSSFTSEENSPYFLILIAILISLAILLIASITLPLIMRFGMTIGTRLVPAVLMMGVGAAIIFFGDLLPSDPSALASSSTVGVIALVSLVLYGASAWLSAQLYEKREL